VADPAILVFAMPHHDHPNDARANEHHIFPTSDRILARALPERRESIILVEQQV
jgi:hypothetical protein